MNTPMNLDELVSAFSMAAELVTLLAFATERAAVLPTAADFHMVNLLNSADRAAEALHATLFKLVDQQTELPAP